MEQKGRLRAFCGKKRPQTANRARDGQLLTNGKMEKSPGDILSEGLAKITRYPYRLFSEGKLYDTCVSQEKTFYWEGDCNVDFFYALLDQAPSKPLKVPLLLGFKEKGDELRWEEWACQHLLIAGMTGSGKTYYLIAMIIAFFHYSHPEYAKLCLMDAKNVIADELKGVATTAKDDPAIIDILNRLHAEMVRRMALLGQEGAPRTAQDWNSRVYSHRMRGHVMPFIVVVFDEFGAFFDRQKKNLELTKKVRQMLSQARSAGIIFCFATQTTYTKYLDGDILANFEERIAFRLKSETNGVQILGRMNPLQKNAYVATLQTGQCYRLERGKRVLYTIPWVGKHALRNAVKNWKKNGFDWSI